jgi:hypothetical protein
VDEHEWEIKTVIMDGWQMMTKYKVFIHDQEVWCQKFDVLRSFLHLSVVCLFAS